jgi:L-lactate dehydrogenase complex protein LldG
MPKVLSEDLIDQFMESAVETTATVEKIPGTPEALNEALLKEIGEEEFVLLSEPDDVDAELFSVFKKNEKVVTQPTKEQLKKMKLGITDAFCGIAKTGSVCVSISKNLTSPASMLTRKHIVVVDGETIVSRPSDLFSENYLNGKGLTRSFSFITGPSATADMGPLVRGVHGPGKLHIIILE